MCADEVVASMSHCVFTWFMMSTDMPFAPV